MIPQELLSPQTEQVARLALTYGPPLVLVSVGSWLFYRLSRANRDKSLLNRGKAQSGIPQLIKLLHLMVNQAG